MVAPKNQIALEADSQTYPLGEKTDHQTYLASLALVALSHSPLEQRIYSAMLTAAFENGTHEPFTARRLMTLAGIRSLSTIRRGLDGLVSKLSIERDEYSNGNGQRELGAAYHVYTPEEIIARRKELGLRSYTKGLEAREGNPFFERAIKRVIDQRSLSRREAQVALWCIEGLTNAEIGRRLNVTEQTVKFHLRHVFIKFGVKRRAELISRLLT